LTFLDKLPQIDPRNAGRFEVTRAKQTQLAGESKEVFFVVLTHEEQCYITSALSNK